MKKEHVADSCPYTTGSLTGKEQGNITRATGWGHSFNQENLDVVRKMRGEYHLEHIRDQEGTLILERPSINMFGPGSLIKWVELHIGAKDFLDLSLYRANIPTQNPVHTNMDPNEPQRPARPVD